jgi:FixJ family two-component response regulator
MKSSQVSENALVFVVDDDPSMRRAITLLMESVGLPVETFESAQQFLSFKRPEIPCCLVLDLQLPDLSGLDLQRELAEAGNEIPIVFITGHGDIPQSVRAMKAGAVEFLTKPFDTKVLVEAVSQAIERDRAARANRVLVAEIRRRYDTLTAREREVMALVVTGMLNKQIGGMLGASEATIKIHRGQVMGKMRAGSVAELVRMDSKLKGQG